MQLDLPVKIGDVLWLPMHNAQRKTRKCSICCGHGSVWVRNIEGEEFEVRCEACGKGYEASTGSEDYYDYEPYAQKLTVTEIRSVEFRNAKCEIRVVTDHPMYNSVDYANLCATESEALAVSKEKMDALVTQNMGRNLSRKASCLPEHAWKARYHSVEIQDAERRIAWHKERLLNKKSRRKDHVALNPSQSSGAGVDSGR